MDITDYKPKSLASNTTWNIFSAVWSTVVTFFLTPFLISHLGTDHYGLFILIMTVSGLMGIMNLGLGEATLRYVAYYYGRDDLTGINRVVSATFSVYILTGLIGWTVLFFGASGVANLLALPAAEHELGVRLIRLAAVNFSLGLIFSAFGTIPQALQRYDISTKVNIAQSLFNVSGIVIILMNGLGIYEIVIWSIASSLFKQVINICVAKELIPAIRLWPSPSMKGIGEIFGYGIFSFITYLMGITWRQADRLLLGAFVSPAAVGYLSAPQQISFRSSGFINKAGQVLLPRFSSMKDRDEIQRLYLDATWVMLCATIVIFVPLTVLFPDFLRLWINPEFARKGAWVGQLIAFSCIFRGAFIPYSGLLGGLGKPQYISYISLAVGLTSLTVNLLLIPIFGLSGAGYAYIVELSWSFTAVVFICRRLLSMESVRPLFHVVALPAGLGLLALLGAVTIRTFLNDPGWVGLFVLGAGIALSTALLIFGVDRFLLGDGSRTKMLHGFSRRIVLTFIEL